jgi:hypothetical protein
MTAAEAAANVVVRRFDARDMEEEGEIEEARVVLAIAGLQPASSDTGLAVAAACRRAKVFTRVDAGRGIIAIERREMARWVQNNRKRQEQEARAPAWRRRPGRRCRTSSAPSGWACRRRTAAAARRTRPPAARRRGCRGRRSEPPSARQPERAGGPWRAAGGEALSCAGRRQRRTAE